MDNVFKIKLTEKPTKIKQVIGTMSFNWDDVEIVEHGANGNAILHFKSGRSLKVDRDFESARQAFRKSRL